MPRRKLHQTVFFAAAAYNALWGAYTVLRPQWLFRYAGMPDANHPEIFACLGMVIGVYGILYAAVALWPERGWLIAAVGLLGKVLGPVGLVPLLVSGAWPLRAAVLCVTNDLIWWIPFGTYLVDAWPFFRQSMKRTAAPNVPAG